MRTQFSPKKQESRSREIDSLGNYNYYSFEAYAFETKFTQLVRFLFSSLIGANEKDRLKREERISLRNGPRQLLRKLTLKFHFYCGIDAEISKHVHSDTLSTETRGGPLFLL